MGEVDEARTAFEKVLATETPFPELDQAKAHLALIGGAKRSLEDLEALRLERPKDPVILMALGQLYEGGRASSKTPSSRVNRRLKRIRNC